MKIRLSPLWLLLAIYYVLTASTYLIWHARGVNNVTGDEPHYLVMARSIFRHGTFEQTSAYKEEFVAKEIYPAGLAPADADPTPENTHSIKGPHGLYNIHNVGLPVLLALPLALGGVVGAKLFMIAISGLIVVVVWKITGELSTNPRTRFLTTLCVTAALPLIPAANQIYPDVLAGLIALNGLYWFLTAEQARARAVEAVWMLGIAFLPLLQIKFAATAILLGVAVGVRIYITRRAAKRVISLWVLAGASAVSLAFYNYYAFGKFSGPYQTGALEFSSTALMVLAGLFLDQNQGFLLQNPILWIGLPAIGIAWRRYRITSYVWLLTFLSLILPNALHPAWYGGFSFSGRFEWAGAITFFLPATIGIIALSEKDHRLFRILVAGSCILQLYLFSCYMPGFLDLYNRSPVTWLSSYSIFYFPLTRALPALYNREWASSYPPNTVWLILLLTVIAVGFLKFRGHAATKARSITLLALSTPALASLANIGYEHADHATFAANTLPSQTGKLSGSVRTATQGEDAQGFITFGPYFSLRGGDLTATITYSSAAPQDRQIGVGDVYDASKRKGLAALPIYGTNGKLSELQLDFRASHRNAHLYEVRTFWNGEGSIEVQNITIRSH